MLLVDTYLDISPGKGIGLFSTKLIKAGTIYWKRSAIFDKISSPQDMSLIGELQRNFIITYGFLERTGNWYLCIDNARFSNHSDNPNTSNQINDVGELLTCTVLKDIQPNEEILCDYRDICQACIKDLGFVDVERSDSID